jgi:hypothetical protein
MSEIQNSTEIRAQYRNDNRDLTRTTIDPAKIDEIHSRREDMSMTIVFKDGSELETFHLSFATI